MHGGCSSRLLHQFVIGEEMPRDNEIQLTLSRFQIYSRNDNETSQTYVFSYSIYSEEKHEEHFLIQESFMDNFELSWYAGSRKRNLKRWALGPV